VLSIQTNGNANYLALIFKRRLGVSNVTHTVQLSDDCLIGCLAPPIPQPGNVPNTPATTEVSRTGTNTETIVVRENSPLGSAPQRVHALRISSTLTTAS